MLIIIKKRKFLIVLLCILLYSIFGAQSILADDQAGETKKSDFVASTAKHERGVVKSISTDKNATVKILSGIHKGEIVKIMLPVNGQAALGPVIKIGNNVVVSIDHEENGKVTEASYYELERNRGIIGLIIIFILLLIVVGGWKGVKSIIALAITGVVVLKIMLPLILKGVNPVFLAVIICLLVSLVNLLIISGINKKTLAAIIGTWSGVITSGIIALYYTHSLQLKGFPAEEAQLLSYLLNQTNPDYGGLLFTGILMGALGAVMDVSISIASSMNEIKTINQDISNKTLFHSGMKVGKDIMGAMSNTLILAYAGSSMYLMFLIFYYDLPILEVLNLDLVASEIVNAMAGSIGLILVIPITALAVILIGKSTKLKP